MRAVTLTCLALVLGVVGGADAATTAKMPSRAFSVVIRGPFSHSWVRVYREGKEWICATESNPYYPAKGDPLADFDWAAMPKGKSAAACREAIAIEDTRAGKARRTGGCLGEPAFKALVARLDKRCRGE